MQLTLQSCSDDHTGTMSPLNKVLQLRPEEIKQPSDRASPLSSVTLLERSTGLAFFPMMDSLSHNFNRAEWSIPIRSRASVEDSGTWSGLFPALAGRGIVCRGAGEYSRGRETKETTDIKSSLFLFSLPLSLLGVHANENKPAQLLLSPRIRSEQSGGN